MNRHATKVGAGHEPTESFTGGDGEAGSRMSALDWEAPAGRVAAKLERRRFLSLRALTVAIVVGILIADYIVPADVILSFLYALALLPALLTRSRRWLWGVAMMSLPLTLVAAIYGPPITPGGNIGVMWSNRSLAILSVFCLCIVLDRHMVNKERLRIALRREREAHGSLRDLLSILDTGVACQSSDTLIDALLARLRAVLHSDTAVILLADSDGQYLTPLASDSMEAAVAGEIRIPIGLGVTGRVAAGAGPMAFDDLTETEVVGSILDGQPRSLVGTALRSEGRLVGVVLAGSSTLRAFTEVDLRLLSLAADRIATVVERTRLHEAERAARRAAEMTAQELRLALKAGRAGTWEWDPQRDINRWSDQVLDLYGIRREEFGGKADDWYAALFPGDRERAIATLQRSLQMGEFELEFRIVRRDNGAVRWMRGSGQVYFESGKPARMLGINVDITEQKHTEAALAARTEELRQTFNGTETGLMRCSRDLRYLAANPAYAQIVGAPLQQIINRPIVEVMGEEGLETIRPYIDRVLCGESVVYESFIPFSVSGPRLLRVAYTPSTEFDGSVSGWIASVTDVTAWWKAEEGLKAAGRQKDEFLAMLAHELRNPLASISNVSELLRRAFASEPKVRGALAILQRQISQLTRLVDDLLDVSRIAQGRINLTNETIEIGTVVDEAVETVQPLVREKSHRLNIRRPISPIYVSGDSARLVQSLGNILHNAAKYTDAGGEIDVEVQELKGDLTIAVHDSGAGIAPELLPRVFDLFVQSPRTLDRSQGGLGIGLTVVKRLIQMHGGTVSAESSGFGSGSTFTIRLPTVPAPSVPASKNVHYTLQTRRVLVVDDNQDAANSLAVLLRLEGHDVCTAYGASDALSAVEQLKPEVVLLDIGLPQMDGYEVARRLQNRHASECPRLIALTGYGQAEDRVRALATGFSEHLTKPVDHEQLRRVLSDRLDAAAWLA
jgi:PAS domain S-box-containing protein